MSVVMVVVGVALVVAAFADLVNTLVTTSTSYAKWWPTRLCWVTLYGGVRRIATRMHPESRLRERMLAAFAPMLLIGLLALWVTMQILGFSLVWWAITGVSGVGDFLDALYYSGVVFFTVGFGEIVPETVVPRAGALIEAFAGVVTTALVIGYLPSLYGAYSERERQLITLDDGTTTRITPMSLLMAWSPDGDPAKLETRFAEWERWAAHVHETHATLPLLRLFRSHDPQQHWITALGVVTDAALIAQRLVGAYDGHAYWLIRRSTALFQDLVEFAPDHALQHYRDAHHDAVAASDGVWLRQRHDELVAHGFDLLPVEEALDHTRRLRANYAPQMEFLIDYLLAPRGFWPPSGLNVPLLSSTNPDVLSWQPDASERPD